jgi:uncharacterized repeat protein (TIGR03803 family)
MNRTVDLFTRGILGCGLALTVCAPFTGADAQETTVYTFTGGNDGGNPPCGLISGGKGALPVVERFFGATELGGASGFGTVFEVTNSGSETVRYPFTGGTDGANPEASVILDRNGNLFGTTKAGGANGLGVVFEVTPAGSESVLHPFAGGNDGAVPLASLIMDKAGNLYGTTQQGGASGLGVVFEVTSGGTESVLHAFAGSDGAYPVAGLIMDTTGNLYGTTSEGGSSKNCSGGCGTIFRLSPGGSLSVLHSFAGKKDGADPRAALIMDRAGNLFGTTQAGGANDDGTVFKLTVKGTETVLHSFAGGSDGANPVAGVIEKSGFLYGTTLKGGANSNGTVFKTPNKPANDTVLYSFTGGSDGALPEGGVISVAGNLFGTAYAGGDSGCSGGTGCGVVFQITP